MANEQFFLIVDTAENYVYVDKTRVDCYIFFMETINQLIQKVIQLPEDQRLSLAHKLLMASEPECSEDVQKAWDMEIRNRIALYDSGETHSRPAREAFKKVDIHLKA